MKNNQVIVFKKGSPVNSLEILINEDTYESGSDFGNDLHTFQSIDSKGQQCEIHVAGDCIFGIFPLETIANSCGW